MLKLALKLIDKVNPIMEVPLNRKSGEGKDAIYRTTVKLTRYRYAIGLGFYGDI